VDGREEDVEWDEAEAARGYQKLKHYEKTRVEFDSQRKQYEEQLAALAKDPVGFLRERGVDLVELGRQEAARAEELAKLDPVQRELAEARQRLRQMEEADAKRVEAEKVAAAQREHQQTVEAERRLYTQAIEASKLVEPLSPNATPAQRARYVAER